MRTRIPTSLILSLIIATTAKATTYTWSGVDGNFSTPASWTGPAPSPTGSPTDQLLFPAGTYTANIDSGNPFWSANTLTFNATSPTNITLTTVPGAGLALVGNSPTLSATGGTTTLTLPALSISGNTTFSTSSSARLSVTINGPITSTPGASLTAAINGTITYNSTTSPTFSGGTNLPTANLFWNFHQTTAAPADISFGSGPITLNSAYFVFTAGADAGAPGQSITLHDDVIAKGNAQTESASAIFLQRQGPVAPNITFAGNITLAGDLWIGNASWETQLIQLPPSGVPPAPLEYSGTVTIDQSTTASRSILAFPTWDENAYPGGPISSAPPVEISGNIVDDPDPSHTAKNPLTLSGGPFVISGANNTYSTGTIIAFAYPNITVAPNSSLGTGNVDIQYGTLVFTAPANIAAGRKVTIESNGTLAVTYNQDVSPLVDPASAGTLALNTLYTHPINLATLGNGNMSLGSSDTGTYAASTLGVGFGHVYRLGHRDGTLTLLNSVLTDSGPIPNSVALLNSALAAPNTYSGGTIVSGNSTAAATGALGSGDVLVTGAYSSTDGPVNYANGQFATLNLSAAHAYHGNLTVYGALAFTGPNGILTTSDPMPVFKPNAILQLGDGLSTNNDRFPDSLAFTLNTNTLILNGAATTTEIMGPLSFDGISNITLQTTAAPTDSTTLITPSLTRLNHGLLAIQPANAPLGSSGPHTNRILLASPPILTNGVLPPYIQITTPDTPTAIPTAAFATYGPNGIAPASFVPMPTNGGTGTEIVDVHLPLSPDGSEAGEALLPNSTSIYALRTNASILIPAGATPLPTLQIGSGGLIASPPFDGVRIAPNVNFGKSEAILNIFGYGNGLTFDGAVNAPNGMTLFGGGAVSIADPATIINGPLTLYDGSLTTPALGDLNTNIPITLYQKAALYISSNLTIARPIFLQQGLTNSFPYSEGVSLGAVSDATLTLAGPLVGSVPLGIGNLNPSGIVRITGNVSLSTFPGTNGFVNGTSNLLTLDGSVSVSSNAINYGRLSGTGSLHAAQNILSYNLIAPGTPDTLGTLTLSSDSGELHFTSMLANILPVTDHYPTGLEIKLASNGLSDLLLVNAPVEIDPGTPLTLDTLAPISGQYQILSAASITGTFTTVAGLPPGYTLDYTPTAILLTPNAAAPEPTTLAFAGISIAVLLRRRSRTLSTRG